MQAIFGVNQNDVVLLQGVRLKGFMFVPGALNQELPVYFTIPNKNRTERPLVHNEVFGVIGVFVDYWERVYTFACIGMDGFYPLIQVPRIFLGERPPFGHKDKFTDCAQVLAKARNPCIFFALSAVY